MPSHCHFTYDQIASTFRYHPISGRLAKLSRGRWIELKTAGVGMGRLKVLSVHFRGCSIQATHLAFMLMRQRWPYLGRQIDHRNGNPGDNTWANLREAFPSQNMMNRGGWKWSGLPKHIYEVENGYQVRVNGQYLGQYIGLEYAKAAAAKAEAELQGQYAYRSRPRPRIATASGIGAPLAMASASYTFMPSSRAVVRENGGM
jgi:hypothetical protein